MDDLQGVRVVQKLRTDMPGKQIAQSVRASFDSEATVLKLCLLPAETVDQLLESFVGLEISSDPWVL